MAQLLCLKGLLLGQQSVLLGSDGSADRRTRPGMMSQGLY
jgi:hypothetical protein